MRSSGLVFLQCAVASLTIACGDSSGPGTTGPANVILVSGDAQPSPEVGTQLPIPLTIRVADAQGRGLSGITVAWSAGAGTLSAASSVTDAGGNASVQWTLGNTAGNQTATATVSGLKPATFTVAAIAGPATQIILGRDSVELLGIGDSFRLNARPADRFGNTISQAIAIESVDPSIVTADNFGSGAILTARASDKTTTIRATIGSIVKVGTVVILPPPCGPGSPVSDIAVGQMVVLSGAAASEFCLQGTANGAEFIAIPYFSDFHGTQLRLAIATGGTTIPALSSRGVPASFQRSVGSSRRQPPRDDAFERGLRDRSISELTPMIAGARLSKQQRVGGFNAVVAAPAIGDILKLNTTSSAACSNPSVRTGRVVAITNRAIVVADTANPANGFTTADYQEFGANFDTLVYPVDTLNFGAPSDIDNNGHVVLFFTRAVNELTPPGVGFYVGGFFFSRDLFPTQQTTGLAGCTTSNFAEMFYLLVPDPAGLVNQNQRSAAFVKSVTVSTLAHEFQHLINASRRLYVNTGTNTFEDSFLDEGLAHIAEELAFFRSSGL
ncbi:MAG TPA: Ig-like domain-containing protein, partial [Gemmatimonadaceae bacterium]|nr:Ig-like domain-containing protein [Gemmatimonadaceae bacterium]